MGVVTLRLDFARIPVKKCVTSFNSTEHLKATVDLENWCKTHWAWLALLSNGVNVLNDLGVTSVIFLLDFMATLTNFNRT